MLFKLQSTYEPKGDQPQAIETLVRGLSDGHKDQVLLGITGSGKTFTVASVIQQTQRPTLVLAHNKTLAAQLYQEFRSLFPENAVEYFVSYYDYYQPEAYMPAGDVYIEKEAIVNQEIDRLRMSATRALFERRDVIVVASVSCIYGLGDPDAYYGMLLFLEPGTRIKRESLLQRLVELQYERSDVNFQRGTFRVRGDVVEIYPSYQDQAFRIELWGEEVDSISTIDPLLGGSNQPECGLYDLKPAFRANLAGWASRLLVASESPPLGASITAIAASFRSPVPGSNGTLHSMASSRARCLRPKPSSLKSRHGWKHKTAFTRLYH